MCICVEVKGECECESYISEDILANSTVPKLNLKVFFEGYFNEVLDKVFVPGIEKAFLFDVVSKIYIATDASLVDMQTYELCCDMIDVVLDISGQS